MVYDLKCFANMFNKMNEINLSLQVKNTTHFDANDKVPFFKEDTCYWFERVEKEDIDYFPLPKRFLNKNNIQLQEKNKVQIKGISKL